MTRVPFTARFLGIAGLFPFAYGVALLFLAPGTLPTFGFYASSAKGGLEIIAAFGAIILGFMGGCLWGFASTRGTAPALNLLALASIPSVFAFAGLGLPPRWGCLILAIGFAALQAIDILFERRALTPAYWLRLRFPLTGAVIAALLIAALHG